MVIVADSRTHDCRVCGKPSYGLKHRWCEYPSTKGAQGSPSSVYNKRRYTARKVLKSLVEPVVFS